MSAGHLNLIFHGSFAFVGTDECVEVLIPVLSSGTACVENSSQSPVSMNFASGSAYSLTGVDRTIRGPRFSAKDTPVLSGLRVINRGHNALLCSLYLPFPEHVWALRKVPVKNGSFFQGTTAAQIAAESLALVHVFTFRFSDDAGVRLGTVGLAGLGSTQTANLHVFSGHSSSPLDDFSKLTNLFPGVDLRLIHHDDEPPQHKDLPRGVLQSDQYDWAERNAKAAQPHSKSFSLFVDNA